MPRGPAANNFQKVSVLNYLRPKWKLLFGEEFKGSNGSEPYVTAWQDVYKFAKSINFPINPKKDNWSTLRKLIGGWASKVEAKIKDRKAPRTGTAAQEPFTEIERLIEDIWFSDYDPALGKVGQFSNPINS